MSTIKSDVLKGLEIMPDLNKEASEIAQTAIKASFQCITGNAPKEIMVDGIAKGFSPGEVTQDELFNVVVALGQVQEEVLLAAFKFMTLMNKALPEEEEALVDTFKFLSGNMLSMYEMAADCMDKNTIFSQETMNVEIRTEELH